MCGLAARGLLGSSLRGRGVGVSRGRASLLLRSRVVRGASPDGNRWPSRGSRRSRHPGRAAPSEKGLLLDWVFLEPCPGSARRGRALTRLGAASPGPRFLRGRRCSVRLRVYGPGEARDCLAPGFPCSFQALCVRHRVEFFPRHPFPFNSKHFLKWPYPGEDILACSPSEGAQYPFQHRVGDPFRKLAEQAVPATSGQVGWPVPPSDSGMGTRRPCGHQRPARRRAWSWRTGGHRGSPDVASLGLQSVIAPGLPRV